MNPTCIDHVDGCADCDEDLQLQIQREPNHECHFLCELGQSIKSTPEGHRLSHEPERHKCGAVLSDRKGNHYEQIRFCAIGNCVQLFCPGCRRIASGWGVVGCPCANTRNGHGTWAEHKRLGAGRLIKKSLNGRRHR